MRPCSRDARLPRTRPCAADTRLPLPGASRALPRAHAPRASGRAARERARRYLRECSYGHTRECPAWAQHAFDGSRRARPGGALGIELAMTGGGELVVAGASTVLGDAPARLHPAAAFHAHEGGVERA